jgi:hypothetical protein
MRVKRFLVSCICLFLGVICVCQIPATELYLFQLTEDQSGQFHIHSPQYLSAFNQGGYTNQPFFISNQELYVSVRKPQENQNDIFSIDISNLSIRQVTKTPQSEYSPTRIGNTSYFGCIRQTTTGENIQNLYRYPIDQSSNGEALIPNTINVGYFYFLEDDQAAVFLVDEPNKLAVANIQTNQVSFLSSNIGRCLRQHSDGSLLYVHKYTDDYWYLKLYDIENKRASIVTETLAGREDFCIDKRGNIFMADGSKLFVHNGSENTKWKLVFDLSVYGIQNISRLAINADNQIAMINTP